MYAPTITLATLLLAHGAMLPQLRPVNPATAPKASVDRFSTKAGHLQQRSATSHLPAANAPVDFDQGPFITHGFGPRGEHITYYNFDVQPTAPAPLYVMYRAGESAPLSDQLPIVDALPGDSGYSDFHAVVRVTAPAGYVANTVTSVAQLRAAGYPMERTKAIENTPIVPEGSKAHLRLRDASAALSTGWFNGKTVRWFTFAERPLTGSLVPLSTIFVSFKVNPGAPNGGPASGFKTDPGTEQTHNVVATLPEDAGYSPLWAVTVYDNAASDAVRDLESLRKAKVLASNVATVNCPVVAERSTDTARR